MLYSIQLVEFDLKFFACSGYRLLANFPHCVRGKSVSRSITQWKQATVNSGFNDRKGFGFLSRENGEDVFGSSLTAIQLERLPFPARRPEGPQFNRDQGTLKGRQAESRPVF